MTLNSASNSFVSFLELLIILRVSTVVLYFNFLSGTTFLRGGVITFVIVSVIHTEPAVGMRLL